MFRSRRLEKNTECNLIEILALNGDLVLVKRIRVILQIFISLDKYFGKFSFRAQLHVALASRKFELHYDICMLRCSTPAPSVNTGSRNVTMGQNVCVLGYKICVRNVKFESVLLNVPISCVRIGI